MQVYDYILTEKHEQEANAAMQKMKTRRAQTTQANNKIYEVDHSASTFIDDATRKAVKALLSKSNVLPLKSTPVAGKTLFPCSTNADNKTFEDCVQANFKNGMNRMKALKSAIAEHSTLHEDYLLRLKGKREGGFKELFPRETNEPK